MLEQRYRRLAVVLIILIATPLLANPHTAKGQEAIRQGAKRQGAKRQGGDTTRPRQAGQIQSDQHMVTEFKGKLKALEQGVMIVTRDDGTDVMVQPPEDISKFQFVAKAQLPFLRQGMLVRFTGSFNRAGIAQSPIARVELFQPISGKVPGNRRQYFVPGVHPDARGQKAG